MSSLVLKEISASNPADQASLELFAQFREHVVRVSATHLLPHHIAVTTKNGFIELINASDGEFRLFLTHLDHIPLDASLRCFALVPSLYAASASSSSSSHRPQHHHHLVYSLSYSNEVLLANMDTGVVRTLTTCVSRPSLVECDGDYIACGEGVGTVSVWRGSAELGARQSNNNNNNSSSSGYYHYAGSSAMGSSLPPLLWQRAVFEDTVTCLGLHRDQLICCSADFQCAVVSVEDGSLRATLSPGIDRAIAAFALPRPTPSFPQQQPSQQLQQQGMAVCLASRIAVFAPRQPPPEVGAEGRKGAVQPPSSASAAAVAVAVAPPDSSGGLEQWSYQGACAVGEDEVTCATCLGAYMAAGTQSGLVLLFSCDASSAGAAQRVAELVRFNVGYGVRGIQLFRNDTLLVVTTAGDVWRWPLEDLLGTARPADDSRGEGEREKEEEEDGPAPVSVAPPQPSAAPGVDATALSAPLAPAPAPAAAATATPNEVSYTQEGDAAEDRNLSAQDISPPAAAAATNTHGTPSHVGAGCDEGTNSQQRETPPAAAGGALTSVHLSSLPGHDDSAVAVSESEEEEEEEKDESSRGGSGGRGGGRADMEDSLGTDALATQPATTLSLPAPPLQLSGKEKPAASTAASSPPDRRTTRERAALYDPDASVSEKVEEEEEEGRGVVGRASDAAVPSVSVEESHLDSPSLLSPPSSADTTAHVESNAAAPRQARAASDTHGSAEGSARDGSRGLPSSSPTSAAAAAATTHERGRRRTAQSSPTAAAAARTETPEMAQLEEEFDQAMARLLGAQPAIEGLRSGRRMDPRKVANILNNVTNQHSPDATPQSPSSTSLGGLNSTKLLEQHRAALEGQNFDFEAFRSTHRLEVDALQYRHPVKALAYTRQDRVFRDVTDGTSLTGGAGRAIEKGATTRAITSGAAAEDELRDVTYGRVKPVVNAAVAEERLRGGPELLQHHCEDLLCPPLDHSCTVLFQEEALRPSTAWEEVLLLPMPLPPASSVF